MVDLTVIILTKDEEIHIGRCVERLIPLDAQKILVIDCFSSDRTQEIAKSKGADVVAHKWPGNQAAQFNWALDNLRIDTKWVLRVDADEYLSDELIQEIKDFIIEPDDGVSLIELPLARTWRQKRVHFGMPKIYVTRLFRYGLCRYDGREMDEKIVANKGRTIRFKYDFIDDNLNGFEWWKKKHLNYAEREARQAIGGARGNKALYYRMPPYLRAIAYWAARYFLFGGFLDGRVGWSWNWWQGLWYRWTVDRRIAEIRKSLRMYQ